MRALVHVAVAAMAVAVAACSGTGKRINALNQACEARDYRLATELADSLTADSARCSIADIADVMVAWIDINNAAVAADSADMARHAMTAYVGLYRHAVARDSADAAKAFDRIADQNPRLNLPAIDTLYTAALTQLATLDQL